MSNIDIIARAIVSIFFFCLIRVCGNDGQSKANDSFLSATPDKLAFCLAFSVEIHSVLHFKVIDLEK